MMDSSVIARGLIPVVIAVLFGVLRKHLPMTRQPDFIRYPRNESRWLPKGGFTAIVFALSGLIGAGTYGSLHLCNRLFARIDRPVLLQIYPPEPIWGILPVFVALAVPWTLTIAIMLRSRYHHQAQYIIAKGSAKGGFDGYRAMVGMNLFLVLPIAFFTVLDLPARFSLTESQIRWTHYASLRPEVFNYRDARRAIMVEGSLSRDGSFFREADLVLDFADGRRLSANALGDGGSEPSDEEVRLLIEKTGLTPQHVHILDDLK